MGSPLEYDTSMLNPFEDKGRRQFEHNLKFYTRMLAEHPWSPVLLQHKDLLIAEIMGGSALGSTALARALADRNIRAGVLVIDSRGHLLKLAERWGSRIGINVQTVEADPFSTNIPGEGFNAVLLHGYSSSLMDPWRLSRLLAGISGKMDDKGIILVRMLDHIYLWIKSRMQWINVLRDQAGSIMLGLIEDYDPLRGMLEKAVLRLGDNTVTTLKISPWSLASLASLIWLFFRDVDSYPRKPRLDEAFMLLGYRPRRVLLPQDLEEPSLLQQE